MHDYHMHYHICHHAEGELHEYVECAIERGLQEIGFSEHIPIPGLDDPTGRMAPHEFEQYVRDVTEAQKKYTEINVRFGIEADYLPPFMNYIEKFLSEYPFDYVIGSVHFVGDWDFSNPAFQHRLHENGADHLWIENFRLLAAAVKTGLYDIIGHIDLPKRLVQAASPAIEIEIERLLESISKSNVALDVNTSGLRRAPWEVYPHPTILQRAFELNIPIVLGSDAHHPQDVAAGFATATEMLKNIGYTGTLLFDKRKSKLTAL